MSWLERRFEGGNLFDWGIAVGIALALTVVFYLARRLLLRRLRRYAGGTVALDNLAVEVLAGTRSVFLLILATYIGAQWLTLPPKSARLVGAVLVVALMVQAAFWGSRVISWWIAHTLPARRQADSAGATTISIIGFIARVVLWAVVVLMILDNLGFDITALVASLGIGGIAIALAAQNVLGDMFASLSIALDKPFALGDVIVVDGMSGTVEYIGLKTTRLRSVDGDQIVFSNTDLLKSRIRNLQRMGERRIQFSFGVRYETDADALERIPRMVREIVESTHAQVRFDRAHFKSYGDFALTFEVVYLVKLADYNLYMDVQQAINLALFRRFQEQGIGFARPTQTLYLQGNVGATPLQAED